MHINKRNFLLAQLALLLAVTTGCSNLHSKSAPFDLNDYKSIVTPTGDQAALLITSWGAPMTVDYSLESRNKVKELGMVYESGDKVLLPWIAEFTKKKHEQLLGALPSREVLIDANTFTIVKGEAKWGQHGHCGPNFSFFTPTAGRRYLALFSFVGRYCKQDLYDISEGKLVLVN
ncbi:hypothetical protein JQR88_10775 [Pseudomonas luteola]|uniref:hypothetical protein n=1 Tax=Pseudomonas luteola TaxID=47886 RepID=UPI003DA1A3F5